MEVQHNVIYRPDLSNKYDDMPSMGHMVIANLTKAGEKVMLIDGVSGEELSGKQLIEKSINLAKGLLAAGVKQGDAVSIVSENRFEFAYVLFGTILNNSILAPINNTYSEREIEHALQLSKPKIIFVSEAVSAKVIKVVKSLTFVEKIVLLDNEKSTDNVTVTMKDFLSPVALRGIRYQPRAVNREKTVCLIMCSSGTTGLPKGVMISQNSMIISVRNREIHTLENLCLDDEQKVILGLLPLFHVFGATTLVCAMSTACARIVLLPKFEQNLFLNTIQKYRCTVSFLVPPLMVFLAKSPTVDRYDISSLRLALCGAAPLSKELEQAVIDRLKNPKLLIIQGYGLSEMTVEALSQKDILKPGSVGDVNAGVYAKVVDEEGNTLGSHKRGELCFKGTLMMLGYVGDASATGAMIDNEGWLHTGDVGYYDEDLQFFIVDRIKELIKWKGFQVPPAELEALLMTHEKILDCGVIGRPNDEAGELATAFVVRADDSLSEADVAKFVADRASYAKRLHGGVYFVREIPKNPSGKILRRELRQTLKSYELKSKL